MTILVPGEMSIKDFMEWYVKEYDGHVLPGDYTRTIDRMAGYLAAKRGGDAETESFLSSAVTLLQDAKNFFEVVKRYADWKYKG